MPATGVEAPGEEGGFDDVVADQSGEDPFDGEVEEGEGDGEGRADEEQARDAVQDAFIKVYGSIRRFEGRSSFYTWLYRLVMNLCIDQKRRDKSARQVEWQDEQSLSVAPGAIGDPGAAPPAEPIDGLHRAQLRKQLAEAIEALPDDARRTFQLREVAGLAYAELAKTLGIPKGTVMSRLHYARRKLTTFLRERGIGPEDAA